MEAKLILIAILGFFVASADACQPCRTPTPKEAFKAADLVVLVENIGNPSARKTPGSEPTQNSTKIKIHEVLKGRLKDKILNIRAYYGMCDYGLLLPETGRHLVFLRKTGEGFETLVCKSKELPQVGNDIDIDGEKIPLSQVVKFLSKK